MVDDDDDDDDDDKKKLGLLSFWVITQRVVVIPYLRFFKVWHPRCVSTTM